MINQDAQQATLGAQTSVSLGTKALYKIMGMTEDVARWLGDATSSHLSYESTDIKKEQTIRPKLDTMASAISMFEGNAPDSRATRNNNPGNLKFAEQPGAEKDKDGFAVFRTSQDGMNALKAQIRVAVDGKSNVFNPEMTLHEFFQKYAPAKDKNHPLAYAQFVAQRMGTTSNTKLKDIFYGN